MKPIFSAFLVSLVFFAATTFPDKAGNAQEARNDGGLEEVVVTARRREEALQDIPLSITAFTAEDIERRSLQELEDIALFTPGFNFEDFGGSGYATPIIRGTTQNRFSNVLEQNVAVFFDGVYLPRNYIVDLGFANVERIEVVKGPQSARYGRNAFMGAINYIPKGPTEEWQIDATATLGDGERYDGAVAISGAIVPEVLRMRVGVDYSEFDGSWDNTHPFADISFDKGTNDTLGGWERTILNATLEFNPFEDMEISVSYYDYDFNGRARCTELVRGAECREQLSQLWPVQPGRTPGGLRARRWR